MTSINTSLLLEICQLNTPSILSSGLFSHVVSACDASRNIFPARLEEDFVTDFINSFIEMASADSRFCQSFCQSFALIDLIEDELTRNPGPARGLYSNSSSPALSHNSILGPALVSALISASVSALILINELFKQFIKTYLELNQRFKQPLAEHKQSF